MADAPQNQQPNGSNGAAAQAPVELSVSEQWERAKKIADAKEAAEGGPPDPHGQVDDDKAPPTELTPKQKAEAKARAGKYGAGEDDEDDGAGDEEHDKQAAKDKGGDSGLVRELRGKLRAAHRKVHEKIEANNAVIREERRELEARYGKYDRVEAALAAGDDEAVIQALFNTDLNGFQRRAVDRIRGRDPRIDRMERENREWREKEEKRQTEEREAKEAEQVERDRHEWAVGLTRELQSHADPVISGLASFSEFVSGLHLPGVFDQQAETFDGTDYASAEEAAAEVLPKWRSVYKALDKIFGDQGASNPEHPEKGTRHRRGDTSAQPPAKAGKKAIAQRQAAEASPANGKGVDDATLIQRYAQRLSESHEH